MAKFDEVTTQVRAICTGIDGKEQHFVRYQNKELYALPGGVEDGAEVISGSMVRTFKTRFTTLSKIKAWAKRNGMTCRVDERYPVFYKSHKP